MNRLTKAEEIIMQVLWSIEKGFLKDILELLPEPKPNYNTVSTIVIRLERKGFIGYKAYGGTHLYFPLISKESYIEGLMKDFIKYYFGDSYKKMVLFFAEKKNLSLKELRKIKEIMKKESKNTVEQ